MADLESYLRELRDEVHAGFERLLANVAAPPIVAEPMAYALLGSGKRLRPCLTLAAAEAVGDAVQLGRADALARARPAACAVEMVHTYSLVHDDLPAMDDDALRRGRATTHVVYGDGLAILAGDGLLTDAFAVLSTSPSPVSQPGEPEAPVEARLRAVATLAAAAGSCGMVGGQAIDLAAVGRVGTTGRPLDGEALEDMHRRKTGALIRASVVMGGILTGGTGSMIDALDAYARELGLAFQIIDDILDVEGSAEALGKTAGKDAAAGKPTFPALYGIEASRRMAADCVARARAALGEAALTGRLADIADWSLARRH